MTIIVQCDCGRTLRAPDQMAGKMAHCVCGISVPLVAETGPRPFETLEPELAEPDANSEEAPQFPRPRSKKVKGQKSAGDKSTFRPSQGPYIERADEAAPPPLPNTKKRKKRRQDVARSDERKRQVTEGFFTGIGRSLMFPIRVESLLTIGVLAVAYGAFTSVAGFLPYGILGMQAMAVMFLGTLLILGYFCFFLLQIFRLASVDEDDLPLSMEFDMEQIRQDLWIWMGTLWWCGMPYAAYWWGSRWLGGAGRTPVVMGSVLGCCLFLFPMALMSTALHLTVLAANPWTVLQSIWRVPLGYVATYVVYGSLSLAVVAIARVLPPWPPVIPVVTHIGIWSLQFYALTAAAYGFGNFYYRNRRKIGWFEELPKQI